MPPVLEITPYDVKTISGEDAVQMNNLWNAARLARNPDDPVVPLEEEMAGWRNLPDFVEVHQWLIWNEHHSQAVGVGEIELYRTEDNQHMAFFDIFVDPAYRRQGLAGRLLRHMLAVVQSNTRRLMITFAYNRLPDGRDFMLYLGAKAGLEQRINQLRIADYDRSLLSRWQAQADSAHYRLGLWNAGFPEDQLPAIAEMMQLSNDAPREQLDFEDQIITPEYVREMEKYQHSRGNTVWMMYAQQIATGRYVGFTETFWNPNRPQILQQGFTGVHPEGRGHGLGRWLKAAMLEKRLQAHPEITHVRTGNANSNVPMLKINTEMGFQLYQTATIWQVETEKVVAYVQSHPDETA